MGAKQKAQAALHVDAVATVREILWQQWDPIGVNHEPGAHGEYDSYASGIVSVIANGGTDHDLAEHLNLIEKSSMGLGGSPLDRRLAVASAVREALAAWGITTQITKHTGVRPEDL